MPHWWHTQLTTISTISGTPSPRSCRSLTTLLTPLLGGSGHHLSSALAGAVLTCWPLEKKFHHLVGGPEAREVVRMMDVISRVISISWSCSAAQIEFESVDSLIWFACERRTPSDTNLTEPKQTRVSRTAGRIAFLAYLDTSFTHHSSRARSETDTCSIATVTSLTSRLCRRSFEPTCFCRRPYRNMSTSSLASS